MCCTVSRKLPFIEKVFHKVEIYGELKKGKVENIMKHLMSGNEATARGVYEAGIKVCSAYPGTPSTEILENLPQYKDDVYCEWAPN